MLSSVPWRESSLRIEIFSRHYGRLSMLARSARRRQSELRGVLMPFTPLSLSWFGANELRTLHKAERIGGWRQPTAMNLMSAFYINELLLKMTAREDAAESLYDALFIAMKNLAENNDSQHTQSVLRSFEWNLLQNCGYAPDTEYDEKGGKIDDDVLYLMLPEHSARPVTTTDEHNLFIHGATLRSLRENNFSDRRSLHEAKMLNRMLLDFRLPESLCSRRITTQMIEF